MQVGLVGVAAVGRDAGRALAGGQAMDGVVEADQPRSAFGWKADLRPEPFPQAFAAPPDLGRQRADPHPAPADDDPAPGPGHLGVHRWARSTSADEQGLGQREPVRPRCGVRELLLDPGRVPTPQVRERDDLAVQLRRGHAQHGARDRGGQPHLHALDVLAPHTQGSVQEPGCEVAPLLPAGGGIDDERAVAELQDQRDGRVRHHANVGRVPAPAAEPRHPDAGHPAGSRRPRDVPRGRSGGSHHVML
jgi:hypothetical protein